MKENATKTTGQKRLRNELHECAANSKYGKKYNGDYLEYFSEGVDLSTQDEHGNTALHEMVIYSDSSRESGFMLRDYLDYAEKSGFDYTIRNDKGETVLHIAAIISNSSVNHILQSSRDVAIDAIAHDGYTAFCYALHNSNFDDAKALLDAGADPTLSGNSEVCPMALLDKSIDKYRKQNTLLEGYKNIHDNNGDIDVQLEKLDEYVSKHKEDFRRFGYDRPNDILFIDVVDRALKYISSEMEKHQQLKDRMMNTKNTTASREKGLISNSGIFSSNSVSEVSPSNAAMLDPGGDECDEKKSVDLPQPSIN